MPPRRYKVLPAVRLSRAEERSLYGELMVPLPLLATGATNTAPGIRLTALTAVMFADRIGNRQAFKNMTKEMMQRRDFFMKWNRLSNQVGNHGGRSFERTDT